MKKRFLKVFDLPHSGGTGVLVILAVAFLIGCVAGCVLVNRVSGNGEFVLKEFLEGYLSVADSDVLARPSVSTFVWETIRWPFFVFLFSVTPLGLFAIPVLFLTRGFLLSFSISSFFRVLGSSGLALAFTLFGVTGVVYVPVLFILGIHGFLLSSAMTGRLIGEGHKRSLVDRIALLRCGICVAVLGVCCLLEYYLIPVLLEPLASFALSNM